MTALEILIVTSAHSAEDGRLIRHKNALLRNGLETEILSVGTANRLTRLIFGPLKAYFQIKRINPACVILPDPELHLFLPPVLKRQVVVVDVHEDYELVIEDRSWIRSWFKFALLFLTRCLLIVRNRWADIILVADASIKGKEAIHIDNRPNILDLPPKDFPDSPPRLVYVGDIRESRGLEEMLSLLELNKGVHLDLVGPCDKPEYLKSIIREKELSNRVIWHGRCSYEESWKIAARALAGLSLLRSTPAFRNTIPTKIWEYWALGLPVLGSDLPGQAGVIIESGGGFIGEIHELSSVISAFVDDPDFARRVGRKGRSYYESKDDENERRLVEAIKNAIAGRAGEKK